MNTGQWLAEARKAAGLSYAETAYRLRDELPPSLWVSIETVRRLEKKSDPDPILVAALARVYGRGDNLPDPVVKELEQIRRVIALTPSRGSRLRGSGWSPDLPGLRLKTAS